MVTLSEFEPQVFQRGGRKQHNLSRSLLLNRLLKPLTLTTYNANWHCRACFYTFVGQPLLKQLYLHI